MIACISMYRRMKCQHAAHPAQLLAMVNSYRFFNSEIHYQDAALPMLLRCLSEDKCDDREKFWMEIRACRRRRQIPIEDSVAVSTAFNTQTELVLVEYNAMVGQNMVVLVSMIQTPKEFLMVWVLTTFTHKGVLKKWQ